MNNCAVLMRMRKLRA